MNSLIERKLCLGECLPYLRPLERPGLSLGKPPPRVIWEPGPASTLDKLNIISPDEISNQRGLEKGQIGL